MKGLMKSLSYYFQADLTDLACMEHCNYNDLDPILEAVFAMIYPEGQRDKKRERAYSKHVQKFGPFCDKFCGGIKVVDFKQMKKIRKQIQNQKKKNNIRNKSKVKN